MTVRGREHGGGNGHRVVRLRHRGGRERLLARWRRLVERIVREEHKRKAGCGHLDLACVGIGVAVDRLDVEVAVQAPVGLEEAAKGLQLAS